MNHFPTDTEEEIKTAVAEEVQEASAPKAKAAKKNKKDHEEKEDSIEELRKKSAIYEGKREAYEGLDKLIQSIADVENELNKLHPKEKKAKENCEKISGEIIRINSELTALEVECRSIREQYLEGITGELASRLTDGEPCMVCGSTIHPHKAELSETGVTKETLEKKEKEADEKKNELNAQTDLQEKANAQLKDIQEKVSEKEKELLTLKTTLEEKKSNLVPGISTGKELDEAIKEIRESIVAYEDKKKELDETEEKAKSDYDRSESGIAASDNEMKKAEELHREAENALQSGLDKNGFRTAEEAKELMLDSERMDELNRKISTYDAEKKAAEQNLASLRKELEGMDEPNEEICQNALHELEREKDEYIKAETALSGEIDRLERKIASINAEGENIEERIRETDEDVAFAKKLRGDTGTGLQRYVLGIMFSSVVSAANKMLEKVHGGRYRLFRSDEKVQGSNKRGLELKVFDKNSEEHEGRFVSTLSGGEKFLASLALSIGMSTVAQRSGIKIEALFIDEGFGSLDDDSIEDAMNVLNSIQQANGLVGIISHVQVLQDQISTKLLVEETSRGSHIVQTIG